MPAILHRCKSKGLAAAYEAMAAKEADVGLCVDNGM